MATLAQLKNPDHITFIKQNIHQQNNAINQQVNNGDEAATPNLAEVANELLEISNAKGWTPERRMRQSQLIRIWRPWRKSSGPKTQNGKINSRQNAFKHGGRNAFMRDSSSLITECKRTLMKIREKI